MSIASRIEAMEGHIADDYEVLELAGADLTDVDKNIINLKQTWQERLLYFINNGTDEVWNNWEKVTGSGTSATLNGTVEAPMKVELKPSELSQEQEEPSAGKEVIDTSITVNDLNPSKISKITLKGNTYQETTTGKNKLNVPSNYSVTGVVNYKTKLTEIGAGTYKLTCGNVTKGGENNPVLRVDNTQYIVSSNKDVNFVIPDTMTDVYFYSNGLNYSASQGVTSIIENLMISESGGDYEPYTNGPSPNPDYPQDIKVVAGENTVTVSNGDNTQSQTYTMSLGTLELYKIGDYQDLFFKNVADSEYYDSTLNENSWYLKKMTGKFTLGNVSWYSYDEREIVATALSNGVFPPPLENSSGYVNCLPLISSSAISNSSEDAEKTGFYIGGGGWAHVQIPISLLPTRDAAGVKSWLSTNNAVLYYALATPQNIEIQNQTLINQLEALYNATTYSTTKINTSTSNLLPYIDLRYNITTGSSPSPTNPSDIHTVSGNNEVEIYKEFFDGEIEQGSFRVEDGTTYPSEIRVRSTNYINVDTYTYTFDLKSSSNYRIVVYVYDENNNYISSESNIEWQSLPFTRTFSNKRKIKFGIRYASNGVITPTDVEQVTVTSPYPLNLGDLEYCKIGDYEDEFRRSTGKNLFDKDNVTYKNGYYRTNNGEEDTNNTIGYTTSYTKIKPNTRYTYSGTIANNTGFFRIYYYDKNKNWISKTGALSTPPQTLTSPENAYYVQIQYQIGAVNFSTIQIEEGNQATDWEPFGTGEWYLKKNIGKVVFDGSENVTADPKQASLEYYSFNIGGVGALPSSVCYCDKLKYSEASIYTNDIQGIKPTSSGTIKIKIFDSSLTTAALFKTWLSNNNLLVYYLLATPTYTLLSDTLQTQLENIYKAMSYDGQTNVSQENNDLPFVLSLSALKDLSE